MKFEANLYKIFLFTPLEDEVEIYNSFRTGFNRLTSYINVINHNLDIVINEQCRLVAITINKMYNNKVNDFFDNQLSLIYSHFYAVETKKNNVKADLLERMRTFNYMYDIEFIADSDKSAAEIINSLLDTCRCCDGVLLNFDGSKFVNGNNELILDDKGNSDL